MKVRTQEKVVVTSYITNEAIIKFDTMVMGEKAFTRHVAGQLMGGAEPQFKIVKGEYLPDNRIVLQLDGKIVAEIFQEV